ncbi:serine/threonine-protein kinase [Propionicimonas sp.]|uniref:serine/threonine-protein kinase n=1 Tax=Propionicimonas sp. TaxID=1955623 RepID=UPI0039E6C09F
MVGFPAIGDLIGAYRVDAEIGHGGMGIVYRATQLTLNRPVALKIVDPRLAADASFVDRFSREASILASLDSPHIIQIFDHGSVDDCLYLAMQYVAGGDVSQLVGRTGPLPPSAALRIFAQVVEALGDAHARGIVHRDVKPSNVLLRPEAISDPFAYLCDFGIAQGPDGGLTQPGLVAGSWAFLSPERHSGAPATPQSDLYSAACVLWTMLTSRNVYSGTDVQVAMSHLNAPVPQLPGSDPLVVALNRLLWACLAKDPADRPDSAAETLALTQPALPLAEDVGPLQISRPDSGIFRPARVVGLEPTRAVLTSASPAGPSPAAAAGPDTPALSPRARGRRRLLAPGAAVLAVLVVAGTLVWSGALGRPAAAPPPATSPTASPSSTNTGFECWDSTVVPALSDCSEPRGRSALEYLYLSVDPDLCTFVDYRASTGAYECTVGTRGLIRYRFWNDSAESSAHYSTKYATEPHETMLLDGHEVGTIYRLTRKIRGVRTMSGTWLDGHFSFSVEAATVAERESLFELVRIRAYDQLNGRPVGAADEQASLG